MSEESPLPSSATRHAATEPIWRLDPDETFSDYDIVIEGEESMVTKLYPVHGVIMTQESHSHAVSEYFACLLRGGGQYSDKTEVHIKLDDEAATHFPAFLDYLYVGELNELSAGKAILLLHLADRFRVPKLIEAMRLYLKKNLSPETLPEYIALIIKFQQDVSMQSLYRRANRLATDIVLSKSPLFSDIVENMDVKFFTKILRRCRTLIISRNLVEITEEASPSIAVAEFLAVHKDHMGEEGFKQLTSEDSLAMIAPDVALELMEIEFLIRKSIIIGNEEATSLQKRCVQSLSKHGPKYADDMERFFTRYSMESPSEVPALAPANDDIMPSGSDAYTGPHHIEIVKAVSEVCGVYEHQHQRISRSKETHYSRTGTSHNGEPCEFHVYKKDGVWRIGDKCVSSGKWAWYYENSTPQNMSSSLPPSWGWKTSQKNYTPVFIVFHRGEAGASEEE